MIRTMSSITAVLLICSCTVAAISVAACSGKPSGAADAASSIAAGKVQPGAQDGTQESEQCSKLMEELRSIRGGEQPCSGPDDCTVWHNGEYWDGCPPEVNVSNAAKLDSMRAEVEKLGCPVETNANCAARIVRGCVAGTCGGSPPFVLHLTEAQKKARDAAILEADRKKAEAMKAEAADKTSDPEPK